MRAEIDKKEAALDRNDRLRTAVTTGEGAEEFQPAEFDEILDVLPEDERAKALLELAEEGQVSPGTVQHLTEALRSDNVTEVTAAAQMLGQLTDIDPKLVQNAFDPDVRELAENLNARAANVGEDDAGFQAHATRVVNTRKKAREEAKTSTSNGQSNQPNGPGDQTGNSQPAAGQANAPNAAETAPVNPGVDTKTAQHADATATDRLITQGQESALVAREGLGDALKAFEGGTRDLENTIRKNELDMRGELSKSLSQEDKKLKDAQNAAMRTELTVRQTLGQGLKEISAISSKKELLKMGLSALRDVGNVIHAIPGVGAIIHANEKDREDRNEFFPTVQEAFRDKKWRLESTDKSVLHQNDDGIQDLKFIHEDGREVIFDGRTGERITDPEITGTYNYVVPAPFPTEEGDWEGMAKWATTHVGHFFADVLPWALWGNRTPATART